MRGWEDYDGTQIRITEKFTHGKAGTPKVNSQGTVPVAATLQRYLDSYRLAAGSPPDGYIFRNASGNPLSIDRLTYSVVRPALKTANIPWYGWHAFRRGFATNLFHLHVATESSSSYFATRISRPRMNVYVKAIGEDGREGDF